MTTDTESDIYLPEDFSAIRADKPTVTGWYCSVTKTPLCLERLEVYHAGKILPRDVYDFWYWYRGVWHTTPGIVASNQDRYWFGLKEREEKGDKI